MSNNLSCYPPFLIRTDEAIERLQGLGGSPVDTDLTHKLGSPAPGPGAPWTVTVTGGELT